MNLRRLGKTDLMLSPIGFGAFKIGRTLGAKYPDAYELPSDDETRALLHGVLDLGVNYVDTAPAYGVSEQRIGDLLRDRANEFIVSTKVGETFIDGASTYDFSEKAVRASVDRSRQRLGRDVLDLVFVHSDGNDEAILNESDVTRTLQSLRDAGAIRYIGFSGKTVAGAEHALADYDALMVEYNLNDRSHEDVMRKAEDLGVGVVVKKALASGHLDAEESIRFVLEHPAVTSVVIGGLNLTHFRDNALVAQQVVA